MLKVLNEEYGRGETNENSTNNENNQSKRILDVVLLLGFDCFFFGCDSMTLKNVQKMLNSLIRDVSNRC